MDTENLKPCPFCGGEGVLKDEGHQDIQHMGDDWFVRCQTCGANVANSQHRRTAALATDAWNRRALETARA